ncbi:MAG: hypothetical protein HZC40_00755 [Chloroflexi bacterium]|nr:hypothetical protein [Chloroflexota bacterium]
MMLLRDQRGHIVARVVGLSLALALAVLMLLAVFNRYNIGALLSVTAFGALAVFALLWFAQRWARPTAPRDE